VREPTAERGFTLIELMIVVAIVAILAAVVVPTFVTEVNKSRGKSEVSPMFAQIAAKEEAYKSETNVYLAATVCPSAPVKAGYNFLTSCKTSGSAWETLRIDPPSSTMYCTYTIEAKTKGNALTPPTGFKNSAGTLNTAETPATSWWYVLAECDESSNGGTNAKYFQSSIDSKIQVINSGS
jgi:type IV pilus assembly protein PilE